ncbi:MAG: DNA methyltransferase [Solirubrobacterales bacterium]
MTTHSLVEDDCRDLGFIPDGSVDLIVTHPPRLTAEAGPVTAGQLSASASYEAYLAQLDLVWEECGRVLAPGGIMTCVASAVANDESELPVAADVQVRARRFGFEARRSIRWIEPGDLDPHESLFFETSNQPCWDEPSWMQDILVLRRSGQRRSVRPEVELDSRMPPDFYADCAAPVWRLAREDDSMHPHGFPLALAERLVRRFSFAGDTVLDPFAGSGTTNQAAILHGRNSIAVEIEPRYFEIMADRLRDARWPEGEITIKAEGSVVSA